MLQGLVTAFRTLTVFPVPGREASQPSAALPFFPVVGCALGLLVWSVSLASRLLPAGGWPHGVAVLMLLASTAATRSLHLDGLADLTDALGAWGRRERLEIMKDSRLGVFGAVSLTLVLLCKWVAFSRLVAAGSTPWLVLAFTISRTVQVELAASLPYARDEGGTAASLVQGARQSQRTGAHGITVLFAGLAFGPLGLAAVGAALGACWPVGSWCRRHLGGVTGDVLGAASEMVETGLLLAVAAPGSLILDYTGWAWIHF